MATTDILKIVPIAQSVAIATHVYKSTKPLRKLKPMKQTRKFVKGASQAIVGTAVLRTTAQLV